MELTRPSYENSLWASQKSFQRSTHAEHLQDLNARISWVGFQHDLHKIFSPCKDTERISPGPRHELLTRTCTISCKRLWQHFTRISTRSSHKEVYKTLIKIFMPGPLRGTHKMSYKDLLLLQRIFTTSWCKIRTRASHTTFQRSTTASSLCKDLLERISPGSDLYRSTQGPLREEFSRISARACLRENLQWKNRRPRAWEPRSADFVRACAVEIYLDISQEQFDARLYRKNAAPTGTTGLWRRNAFGHLRRAVFCENLQEKCRAPRSGADFVRACAIEMHMDMLQEPFYARIYRKNAAPKMEHPDQAPALTPAVRP